MEALKEYGMIFISLIIFPGLWLAVFRRLDADDSQSTQPP